MNLLSSNDLSELQITEILELTDKLKIYEDVKTLKGKTFVLFFPESSIRTRITFEKGVKDLRGECILFPPESLDKREIRRCYSIYRKLGRWCDY